MKMNLFLSLIILSCSFFLSSCKEKCHRKLTIVNNSQDSIIVADIYHNGFGKYKLGYRLGLSKNSEESYVYRHCMESEFSSKNLNFYIVDPNYFNAPQVFYSYDSINIKNRVLKHYDLKLDDLKNNNFTITYP